jgi:hypothetical protein
VSFLSRVSLANRKLVALVTAIVVAFGVYATLSLRQQLLPDLSFPAVTVVATYPGAAPEVVDQQVTIPIENAVKNLGDVESTTSTSQQGSATVLLSFGFVLLVVPLLAALLLWQAGWAAVLHCFAAPPWLIAAMGGLIVAWPITVALPLTG